MTVSNARLATASRQSMHTAAAEAIAARLDGKEERDGKMLNVVM